MTDPARLGYRPELDGLRGVAILLVIALHAGIPVRGSGRAGVDLFFVLSGYLITSLMLEERLRTGAFDLRAFYVRRMRRLIPALVAALIGAAAVAAYYRVLPEIVGPIAVAAAYLGAWAPWLGVDMRWLEHTWTLGVEEQFYMVWPLLWLAYARWPRIGAALGIGIGLIGVAFRSYAVLGLAGGCALAMLIAAGRISRVPRWLVVSAWVGFAATMALPIPFQGEVLTGFACVIVAAVAVRPSDARSSLSWQPLVLLGLVSYGLYLWHYIIFALPIAKVVALPLSIAAAAFSYRYIERPFRLRRASSDPDDALEADLIAGRPSKRRRIRHDVVAGAGAHD